MLNVKISGFADEIASGTTEQFEHLNKLNIEYFEPRGIDGKNISDLTNEEAVQLKLKMDKYGIKASSIGSPIGKIFITDEFEPHIEKLKTTIQIAKILETKYIRIFSFFIPSGEQPSKYRDEVIRRMKIMADIAEKEGIILLHENEKEIYGDIAERCLDVLHSVNSPNLRAVFDPANFVQCGENTHPDAYNMLEDYIEYMHIKDAVSDGTVVPAGHGEGNVEAIITKLSEKNYNGFLSLEPHLGSFEGLAQLELDDEMLKLEKSDSTKFILAYNELKKIIDKINGKV